MSRPWVLDASCLWKWPWYGQGGASPSPGKISVNFRGPSCNHSCHLAEHLLCTGPSVCHDEAFTLVWQGSLCRGRGRASGLRILCWLKLEKEKLGLKSLLWLPRHPPLCSACDWSSAQTWHQHRAILGCEAVGTSGAAADPGPARSEEPAKGSHSLSLLSGAPLPWRPAVSDLYNFSNRTAFPLKNFTYSPTI